jgi:hypothetical protein
VLPHGRKFGSITQKGPIKKSAPEKSAAEFRLGYQERAEKGQIFCLLSFWFQEVVGSVANWPKVRPHNSTGPCKKWIGRKNQWPIEAGFPQKGPKRGRILKQFVAFIFFFMNVFKN